MAVLAKENIDEYLTIPGEIAQTAVDLMKFYVDTKKLLYGFPLITIPPSQQINVGPSVSQLIQPIQQNNDLNIDSDMEIDSNKTVITSYSKSSTISSSICPFTGSIVDETIKKILFYKDRTISSSRVAQTYRST
jgi:hypothetical protein